MDSRGGFVVEVENAGAAHAPILEVPAGTLAIDPGRRLWMVFFDTEEGARGILVGGLVERWEEALLDTEPVLQSVRSGISSRRLPGWPGDASKPR